MSLDDDAIDRAVEEIVAHDAPADLRARVGAAIDEPSSWRERRAAWPRPFAPAAWTAAAAVALAAGLWLLRPAPPVAPLAPTLAGARPIVELAPAIAGPEARRDLAPRPAAPARLTDVMAATSLVPAGARPLPPLAVVDPLAAPPPIDITPLSESRVGVEPIAIDPLTFTPMSIAPLVAGR